MNASNRISLPYIICISAVFLNFSQLISAQNSPQNQFALPAVNPFYNEEVFPATSARYLRFMIARSSSRNPGLDEIEVYTDEAIPRNVALAQNGASFEASSTAMSAMKYSPEKAGDGLFGQRHAWISSARDDQWIEIAFTKIERINRVVWSRDRTETAWDRVPLEYQIEVAEQRDDWKVVASSHGRRPGLVFPTVKLDILEHTTPVISPSSSHPPINSFRNEDVFSPVLAQEVRFSILQSVGEETKLDEIEIYPADGNDTNLALAAGGTVIVTSVDGKHSKTSTTSTHALNDGLYGSEGVWSDGIENLPWVQVRLGQPTRINRVVWSRDRTAKEFDGAPTRYQIEVLNENDEWQIVSSSQNRRQLQTLVISQQRKPPSDYLIDTWTATDEFRLNEARAIAQTKDGYLWIGTDHGLLRFDGNKFKSFNRNNTPILSTPRIDYLHVDREERLWMTNQKFFYDANNNVVVYEHGEFRRIELPSGHKFHQVIEEKSGEIWLLTDNSTIPYEQGVIHPDLSLYKLDLKSLKYPKDRMSEDELIPWKGIIGAWVDDTFISTFGLDGFPLPELQENSRMKQHGRRDGGAWIIDLDVTKSSESTRAQFRLLAKDGSLKKIRDFPWDGNPSVSSLVDKSDNLWVSPLGMGLFRISADGQQIHKIPGLENLYARRLFQDRDSNIWITTRYQGLLRLRKRMIHSIGFNQGMQVQEKGAIAENVYSIAPASSGGVWIGTHASGAYLWQDGQLSSLLNAFSHTWAITEDRIGNVWTGAYGKNVRLHQHGRVGQIPMVSGHPFSFLENAHGRLWIGGDFGLSYLEDGVKHQYVPPHFAKDKFEWTNSLLQTDEGACWLGTKRGYLHRFKDEVFETLWKPQAGDEFPVCALYLDASNALWFARFGYGLSRLQDGKITHFTPKEGLPTATINGILEDKDGFLWMTSKAGVFRISKFDFERFSRGQRSGVRWQQFTVKDGLPSNTCQGEQNQPSMCQTPDGRIWVPTIKGIGIIDPKLLGNKIARSEILIQDLTLYSNKGNGEQVLFEAPRDLSADNFIQPISIPPGNHSIRIRYTAIDFTEPTKVQFRYRIIGWDDQWIDAQNERSALIASLGHGRYQFEVMAINHLGQESSIAVLPLVVRPFWWETATFQGCAIFTLFIFCGFAYRYRVQVLERRNQQQTEFSRQLIEREEAERKRIAQELHDSLGHELLIVRNRALEGINKASSKVDQTQFETISEMAGHALENTRGLAYNLRPFELDRIGFSKAVETMISKISEGSETRYFKEIDELEGILPHDNVVYLYRLIQEGLNNILKHAKASVVMLEIKVHDRFVHVQMSDNGVGFDVAEVRKGLGISGMEERAKLIGGQLEIVSSPNQGASLSIRIPINPLKPS